MNRQQVNSQKSTLVSLAAISLSSVEAKATEWLWKNWLPLGKLVLFAGEGGTGKTNIAMSIASTISTGGSFPDGAKCEVPRKVLIYSSEDSVHDSIKPRIMSYNGDDSNIMVMQGCYDQHGRIKPFNLDEIDKLYRYAEANPDLRLIIFDPIVSLLKKDMNQANYVRQTLEPLLMFAEKFNCTILCITHLSKAKRDISLLDRIIGSQAFTALARVVLATTKIQSSGECYFSKLKSNVDELQNINLAYQIDTVLVGDDIETSTTKWGEPIEGHIDDFLIEKGGLTRLTQREKAEQIILEKLTLQSPISSKEMEAWYLAQGISKSTAERVAAGTDMIKREKCGDIWYWSLKE